MDADVCVIGSGAGGAPIALSLAQAGLRVVVLERGPARTRAAFVHDELAMARRDFFVPLAADDPHHFRTAPDRPSRPTSFGWIARCVGGGTVPWAGYALRLHPDDFRRRTLGGQISGSSLEDWPISYDELEPYYARAERELGVSGDASGSPGEPPRSGSYPHPPLPANAIAALIEGGAEAVGAAAGVTPRAILALPEGERGGCSYCALCSGLGCEQGAKGSTPEAILPRALATGRCTVRPDVRVDELRVDRSGRVAAAIATGPGGVRSEVRARAFVVACSAIESARLLLNSRSSRFPRGLANGSGLLGRNLMLLTMGRVSSVHRFGGRAGLTAHHPLPFVGRCVRERSAGAIVFGLGPRGPIHVAERASIAPDGSPVWGAPLTERLRSWMREGVRLEAECFSECVPVPTNAVDVDGPAGPGGVPAARITFAHHPHDGEVSARLVARAADILEASGADEVGPRESGGSFEVIQAGTARFGHDSRASVLDADCRAHEVPNLWVTDGSFLPTSGSVPLTLTIVANALRVADAMARRHGRGQL